MLNPRPGLLLMTVCVANLQIIFSSHNFLKCFLFFIDFLYFYFCNAMWQEELSR